MRKILLISLIGAAIVFADVRVNVRLGAGHPIRRHHRTVVVRPARPGVVVRTGPVVYAAPVVWTRSVVALPPRDRLVWEDSETIRRREDWVDTTLRVNNRGEKLLLRVDGRAQLDFAEVHFDNGQVQVVDFNEHLLQAGTYSVIDFKNGRKVDDVRVVVRARSPEARLTMYMVK